MKEKIKMEKPKIAAKQAGNMVGRSTDLERRMWQMVRSFSAIFSKICFIMSHFEKKRSDRNAR